MRDKVINLIREIEKEYWSTCEETAEDNYKKIPNFAEYYADRILASDLFSSEIKLLDQITTTEIRADVLRYNLKKTQEWLNNSEKKLQEQLAINKQLQQNTEDLYKELSERTAEEVKIAKTYTAKIILAKIKENQFNPNNKFDFIYDEIFEIIGEFIDES